MKKVQCLQPIYDSFPNYLVNIFRETFGHWDSPHEETVVLVGRLGQTHLVGLLSDSLSVGDDGVGFLDWDLSVILLKILQTDLQVEFSGSGNDVLAGLFNDALYHRVRLGQTLKTYDEKKNFKNPFSD
jgi:hypothetical protein